MDTLSFQKLTAEPTEFPTLTWMLLKTSEVIIALMHGSTTIIEKDFVNWTVE